MLSLYRLGSLIFQNNFTLYLELMFTQDCISLGVLGQRSLSCAVYWFSGRLHKWTDTCTAGNLVWMKSRLRCRAANSSSSLNWFVNFIKVLYECHTLRWSNNSWVFILSNTWWAPISCSFWHLHLSNSQQILLNWYSPRIQISAIFQ